MPDTPYLPSTELDKVPPSRGSMVTCWAVDLLVAGFVGVGTGLCAVFLLIPWGLHSGTDPVWARLDAWAAWLAVGVAFVASVLSISLGRDRRSPGHQLAEVRTDDRHGRPASAPRRVLRAAILLAVVLVLGLLSWLLAVLGTIVLVATSALPADRRGLVERLAGVRDYQTRLVPVPARQPGQP